MEEITKTEKNENQITDKSELTYKKIHKQKYVNTTLTKQLNEKHSKIGKVTKQFKIKLGEIKYE